MTYTGAIKLSEEEQALFDRIVFDPERHNPSVCENNGEAIAILMRSLDARKAIPQHRIDYILYKNKGLGSEILKHPHFLPLLRYALFGAGLPQDFINKFRSRVEDLGTITSGDMQTICKMARELMRQYRLEPRDNKEEIYKLCLDCGLDPGSAKQVRDAVR